MVGEAGRFKAYALTRSLEFRNKIVTIFPLSFILGMLFVTFAAFG